MKAFVSFCLALALAVTLGSPATASKAAQPSRDGMAANCADMGMMATGGDAASSKHSPVKDQTPNDDCSMVCATGCAVTAQIVADLIGEPIGWDRAFGRPAVSLAPASANPEAEDPPPRTLLI